MIQHYDIRKRRIGMSTQSPEILRVDALVLPWSEPDSEHPESPVLTKAGEAVREEIAEYKGEREVMLTSGGTLPTRFLFHLSMPAEGKADLRTVEARFRDCFFQASVLGIQEIAVSLVDFSCHVDSFSELVGRLWDTSREFLAREKGPQRLILLVDDRDLRGQYLRHFLDRKEAEDRKWERLDGAHAVPNAPDIESKPAPNFLDDTPRRVMATEQVLNLELDSATGDTQAVEERLEAALDDLIEDYRAGRALAGSLDRLAPTMSAALAESMAARGGGDTELSERLRVLGGPLVMRLPWELLQAEGEAIHLGEDHLFTRGTNFLHFRRRGNPQPADPRRVSLRVMGEAGPAQILAGGLQEMVIAKDLEVQWSQESNAAARFVHCLDKGTLEGLLLEDDPACELVFADLPPGEDGPDTSGVAEIARRLLAQGCRHVLAPLAAFRSSSERDIFRAAFYERVLSGASPGEALRYGQRVLMEAHGTTSGWWLYRLYGQTDAPLLPAKQRQQTKQVLQPR